MFVYRTTYLHEADLVANEFERQNIAFYRAVEGPAGVRFAMPLSPAWEPGLCFLVVVPGSHGKRARSVLDGLPVSRDSQPGVWQPGMSEEDKRFWRTLAWFSLAAVAVSVLGALVAAFR
jgi:hypothetical protein